MFSLNEGFTWCETLTIGETKKFLLYFNEYSFFVEDISDEPEEKDVCQRIEQ
jgi:hypothetical protein